MTTVRSTLRSIGAATAVAALLVAGSPAASGTAAAADEIPILGQALTMGTVTSGPPAVVTVHGVQRVDNATICLLYTSPSPRDRTRSRMPSSA